jgi:hypothetical protein
VSVAVELDPNVEDLLKSVGLLDGDGHLVGGWFQDPIGGVRQILSDPQQRAALLELLRNVLGEDGAGLHDGDAVPLLDPNGIGNVYLTIDGDVIGVAAALTTPGDVDVQATASVSLPLIDTAGDLRAVAGTADGPLEIAIEVTFDSGFAVDALRLAATVDLEGDAAFRFVLEGVDVGAGPETLEVTSAHLGRDLVRAVETLVKDALSEVPGVDRVADHLLGALGLDGVLPPLPLDHLANDPAALHTWLATIAGTPADLEAWFAHVSGLLGADPPSAAEPLAARIVAFDDDADAELELRVAVAGNELQLMVAVVAHAGSAALDTTATLLAIPLSGPAPVRVVPRAAAHVRAPSGGGMLIDDAPTLQVGSLRAGVAFDGTGLVPELLAFDVVLEGVTYPSLDLTSANAVIGAATAGLRAAIEDALGDAGPAQALLALLGIVAPATDATTPHLLDFTALAHSPTAAIAEVHRGVLADPAHDWSHLLAELGAMMGLTGPLSGTGTPGDPWRQEIAADGPLSLDLAAWNARDAGTPAGEQQLRVGLLAEATVGPWTTRVASELLAFDLPASGAAAVRLIGRQELSTVLSPIPDADTGSGISFQIAAVRGIAAWAPGAPLSVTARVENVRVAVDDDQAGPVTLVFPPADPSAPDLGLGVAVPELIKLLRLLARHAMQTWGGDGARALGELLGLYGDGPLLVPPDANDIASLFARPGDALRERLRALALDVDADGRPYADRALAQLAALLRDQVPAATDGFAPRLDAPITGQGTYDQPWGIGVAFGDERAELIAWLDPAGPPASWAAGLAGEVAAAADAATLVALVPRLAALLDDLPLWLGPDAHAAGLEALAAWIAAGDGVSPLASQLPGLPGWIEGPPLSSPHDAQPADPDAIAQLIAQLDAWTDDDGRAVLFVGPRWSDHTIWDTLIAAAEPGRRPGAHFDLRGGGDPATVTAVASHYTADLDDDGSGNVAALAAQITGAADRIAALTGRSRVIVVAHSTPGVAARVAASDRPDVIRAVATLGTPHLGVAPLPLTDASLADAVRAARTIGGLPALLTAVLDRLDAALDGLPGAFAGAAFAPVPGGTVNAVPGFALGSSVGGDLVAALAQSLAARLAAVTVADRPTPTHLGVGARVLLPVAGAVGEPSVDAWVRIDAGRIALVAGAADPPRPPQAATLHVAAERPGGWLVGDAVGDDPRIRSAQLDLTLVPAAGSVTVSPRLILRDVVLGAARRDVELGDDGLTGALSLLSDAVGAHLDPDVLTGLVEAPTATLLAQRDELLDALETALGGALGVPLTSVPLELTLDRATWALKLRTTADLTLGEGVGLGFDAGLALKTMRPTLDASLNVGVISLTQSAQTGTLTLAADPWLAPLVVLPLPPAEVLRDTLLPVVPRVALSVAVSAGLGEVLGGEGAVGALDALLADPGARLAQLSAGDIQDLLKAVAEAVGVDATNGLALPGGLLLTSSGQDPLRVELSGSVDLDTAGDTLGFDLALEISADRRVAPSGTLTVDAGLPGTWGRIVVAFSASQTGVGLVVTPDNAQPITLLPRFSGFGALVTAGATSLLPHLLQAIVEELTPAGGSPTGVLQAVLAVATDLQIYDDDAQGFEAPARAARLAQMLQPGWIENELSNPSTVAGLIAGLFGPPPLLEMPIGGPPIANGDAISWTAPLPQPATGSVTVEVHLGSPAVKVTVDALDVGPLVVDTASVGYDGDLVFDLALHMDPGGNLAFLTPSAQFGVADERVTASLLPLGAARSADLDLVLAPAPALTFTTDGAIALLTDWGVPLVAMLALSAAEAVLDDPLWTNGPTTRKVLEDAGLVVPDAAHGTPQLDLPLPALDALALGAVEALAADIVVPVTDTLTVAIVDDGSGRKGLRLTGSQDIDAGDMTVSMSFGAADWLDDPAAGVTLWLLGTHGGGVPTLDPGLSAVGLGAMLANTDDTKPLLDGALTIGRAGGLIFFTLNLLDPSGQPDVAVSDIGAAVDLRETKITVASDDGDSFIQKLLPPELQAPFELAVSARAGRGLELFGGIGDTPGMIELTFPLDLNIADIVQIDEVFVSAGKAGSAVELIAAISGGATLGPIAMSVQRVGLRADLTSGGVQFGFKAPDGLGLSLDTGTVKAGGFLLIDDVHGRYVGAIEIDIAEKFAIVAIGIITTKNPDGTPGFSLLLLIAIRFPVPIPLGYGFFFAGAGGLLGLNRGIDLDRLRLGLRSGTAESILFPTDIVARINTIVRDLEEVFPVASGRFLIAPMAMITWSSPPLITAEVGVIIEIGSPLRLGLLGLLKLELPEPENAVVSLKVAFLGALDIPGSMLSFDASIYDSYLGYDDFKLSLEGDIAFRICWGAQPDFVTSVGGFHPAYRPAAHLRLPPLRRMSISLLKDNPRITLSSYFAITTNSVQFGAKIELVVRAGDFSIEGELGLDVLVQIVPVYLEAHIYGRVSIKAGGSELLTISLDLTAQGPTPWMLRGKGKFKILFVSVTVSFEKEFGQVAPATLPTIAVLGQLLPALQDDAAWSAQLASGANELVHLIPPPAGTLVLDAAGLLTISQRVVPLGTDFSLFGTATPNDVTRVDVHELRIGEHAVNDAGSDAAQTRPVADAFAPAAFRKLSDADKLSSPAFEQRQAGVQSVNGTELTTDAVVACPVVYETIELDAKVSGQPARGTGGPASQDDFEGFVAGGVIGSSPASRRAARAAQRGEQRDIGPARERYAVAQLGDLIPLDADGVASTSSAAGVLVSRTDAEARRDGLIRRGVSAELQIVPEAQLAA